MKHQFIIQFNNDNKEEPWNLTFFDREFGDAITQRFKTLRLAQREIETYFFLEFLENKIYQNPKE